MTHNLKIWPQYYCRVQDGTKTFEIRKNDRGFQNGDIVVLDEYDPTPREVSGPPPGLATLTSLSPRTHLEPKGYTGVPALRFKIGYVHQLDAERVVFSLLPILKESHEVS
jgi:hypothetical protein